MTAEQILLLYDKPVIELAAGLRHFLLRELPGVSEIPDPAAKMLAYGYGPGYKDMICTILLSKKGVKLGFYKGSELPDPAGLLTGSGKVHRYVGIKTNTDLKNKNLTSLLAAALQAYHKRSKKI
jgi:hypothetical protein